MTAPSARAGGTARPDRHRGDAAEALEERRTVRLRDVLAESRAEIEMLTGRPVDSVSSVHRSEDGWTLTLEVVELERVPASTSVLGTYEVVVDAGGAVVEYDRVRRYYRNQASEADS